MTQPTSVFAYNTAGLFDEPQYILLTEDFPSRDEKAAEAVAAQINEALAVAARVTALRDRLRADRSIGQDDAAVLCALEALLASVL